MPPRAQYQPHRYCVRPSSKTPAPDPEKSTRTPLAKRARHAKANAANGPRNLPITTTRGFLSDLRKLAAIWTSQAKTLEDSAGARFITDQAARRARVQVLRRVAKMLRELIDREGV